MMDKHKEFDFSKSLLKVHPLLPKHYIFDRNSLGLMRYWLSHQNFDSTSLVLGCGTYGHRVNIPELQWVANKVDKKTKHLIVAADPTILHAADNVSVNPDVNENIGPPFWLNQFSHTAVALTEVVSSNTDLINILSGKVDRALFVVPDVASIMSILHDLIQVMRPKGMITIIIKLDMFMKSLQHNYVKLNQINEDNILNFISGMTTLPYDEARTVSLPSGSQINVSHLPYQKYKDLNYPPSNFITKDNIVTVLQIQM